MGAMRAVVAARLNFMIVLWCLFGFLAVRAGTLYVYRGLEIIIEAGLSCSSVVETCTRMFRNERDLASLQIHPAPHARPVIPSGSRLTQNLPQKSSLTRLRSGLGMSLA